MRDSSLIPSHAGTKGLSESNPTHRAHYSCFSVISTDISLDWLPNHILVIHILLLFSVLTPFVLPFGVLYFLSSPVGEHSSMFQTITLTLM